MFRYFFKGLVGVFVSVFGCILISSCSIDLEQSDMEPEQFFLPYENALKASEGSGQGLEGPAFNMAERTLVHLGIPEKNSLVICYVQAESQPLLQSVTVEIAEGRGGYRRVSSRSIEHLQNITHKAGRITIRKLKSGKSYRVRLSGAGIPTRILKAKTRQAGTGDFSFLVGSCFQPWHFTKGSDDTYISAQTAAILNSFKNRASDLEGPSFYLGLGDQIYTDPGANDGTRIAYLHGKRSEKMRGKLSDTPDVLRGLYRYHFGLRPMDQALTSLPSAMMWDDHDLRDGWGSQRDSDSKEWKAYYNQAREAFLAFQALRNPSFSLKNISGEWRQLSPMPRVGPIGKPMEKKEMNFEFEWGLASFFIVDSRSERDLKEGQTVSKMQIDAVQEWVDNLGSPENRDKPMVGVLCFPVPFAGGRSILTSIGASDIARGLESTDDASERIYINKEERDFFVKVVYDHFKSNQNHKLLIVSGDVHYTGLQVLRNEADQRIIGYEVISSGLSQTKFNDAGAFVTSVGRTINGVTTEDFGYYAGPAFSEIFISGPKGSETSPEVKVTIFPGAHIRAKGKKNLNQKRPHPLLLNTSNSKSVAKRIENYSPNLSNQSPWSKFVRTFFGRDFTISQLPDQILSNDSKLILPKQPNVNPEAKATSWYD